MAKVTMKDLIDRKEKKRKNTATLHVDSLGGEIVIEIPSRSFCVDALQMAAEGRDAEADTYIVYNHVIEPNLKDKKLQDAYDCAVPDDIVDKVFLPGEVSAISGHCLELAGYGQGVKKLDDDLKN